MPFANDAVSRAQIACTTYLQSGECTATCAYNHNDTGLLLIEPDAKVFWDRQTARLMPLQNLSRQFAPPRPLRPDVAPTQMAVPPRRVPCRRYLMTGTCVSGCPFNHNDSTLAAIEPDAPLFWDRLSENLCAVQNTSSDFAPPRPLRREVPMTSAGFAASQRAAAAAAAAVSVKVKSEEGGATASPRSSGAVSSSAVAANVTVKSEVVSTQAHTPAAPPPVQPAPRPCDNYFGPRGVCRRGAARCRFSHDRDELARHHCNRFLTRHCPLGASCPMMHDELFRVVVTAVRKVGDVAARLSSSSLVGQKRGRDGEGEGEGSDAEEGDCCLICLCPCPSEAIGCCHQRIHASCLSAIVASDGVVNKVCPFCRSAEFMPTR